METQPEVAPAPREEPLDPSLAAAQFTCAIGAAMAAFAALMPTLEALLHLFAADLGLDPGGSGTWLDYASVVFAAWSWTIAALLLWAAMGLGGRHRVRARRVGLTGAALTCAAGVGICLAPLTDARMAAAGGWGQPWMPEVLIGGLIVAFGLFTMVLLKRTSAAHPGGG